MNDSNFSDSLSISLSDNDNSNGGNLSNLPDLNSTLSNFIKSDNNSIFNSLNPDSILKNSSLFNKQKKNFNSINNLKSYKKLSKNYKNLKKINALLKNYLSNQNDNQNDNQNGSQNDNDKLQLELISLLILSNNNNKNLKKYNINIENDNDNNIDDEVDDNSINTISNESETENQHLNQLIEINDNLNQDLNKKINFYSNIISIPSLNDWNLRFAYLNKFIPLFKINIISINKNNKNNNSSLIKISYNLILTYIFNFNFTISFNTFNNKLINLLLNNLNYNNHLSKIELFPLITHFFEIDNKNSKENLNSPNYILIQNDINNFMDFFNHLNSYSLLLLKRLSFFLKIYNYLITKDLLYLKDLNNLYFNLFFINKILNLIDANKNKNNKDISTDEKIEFINSILLEIKSLLNEADFLNLNNSNPNKRLIFALFKFFKNLNHINIGNNHSNYDLIINWSIIFNFSDNKGNLNDYNLLDSILVDNNFDDYDNEKILRFNEPVNKIECYIDFKSSKLNETPKEYENINSLLRKLITKEGTFNGTVILINNFFNIGK
ncbi:uncharacterized protein ASCRUDRAFT_10378 [Ascoidea rubescens DSM 1968]|uniref:Uncharacterized protein n=1 Tax=Ascoidea rubescens DSM 1968 TaxID=1344418 RepID=A0A1D2V9N9_9ASCO|nr:hypothetical protein ASCRUDRAFT_10378 [Ascoidea rubescens DSM 1968]ODV58348.1 hypothetical protein ASCRUDRAFT_10378 [Ascoidea rubescens DSM 1968]